MTRLLPADATRPEVTLGLRCANIGRSVTFGGPVCVGGQWLLFHGALQGAMRAQLYAPSSRTGCGMLPSSQQASVGRMSAPKGNVKWCHCNGLNPNRRLYGRRGMRESDSQRGPIERQPLCIVDQAVQDRIGEGRFVDDVMPGVDRELAGDDRGPSAVSIPPAISIRSRRWPSVSRSDPQSSRNRTSALPSEGAPV